MKLKDIFEILHGYGRCCLNCGAWFTKSSLFCRNCEETLWERHYQNPPGSIDEICIETLFQWRPDEDRQLSKLLTALKGGRLEKSFEYYCHEFLIQKKHELENNNMVLVPCPGKRPDHAWALAQHFSRLFSLPIQDVLVKESKDELHQKDKNRFERSKLRFSCQETMRQKHVIFIDDIVTTGATVRAARKAIGPCQSFRVWALAQRVVSLRASC